MSPDATPFSLETQAIHSGSSIDPATGALTAPIHLSTTFERDSDGSYPKGYVYGRSGNPNRDALETALTTLEKGAEAATFASGSAATFSLLQALSPADHVIAPQSVYFGVQQMLSQIFAPWGLSYTLVDTTDLAAVAEALRPNTRLLLIETPSNPQLAVTDIQAVADLAHQANAYLACDNTIASPVLQTPLTLGADFVIHATTKYLAGHGDVIGGAVVTRETNSLFDQLRLVQTIGGVVPSPFDCWLTLRGLQTLPLRVHAQSQAAQTLATWLSQHSAIEQVLYPGLPEHPGHDIAQKQMQGYGGLLSFLVKGDQETAMAVAAKTRLIARATSFGSPHSAIEHRASIEKGTTTAPNLLRLSVGLEHVDDLIADLDQALTLKH
ncbi:trans-sulfuration enzyme family protein [Phormidium tenue]|uniref:homocysteine desulfhydrase n=1 Tax=Phormidium tenue NIES-30 TaxID=549789 RepID=A0A1U7JAW7_9CYAN|nr:aminotransferase class V-fold PLP-dependent enzyme [Phormidium tenue]MBD2230311.1 aminotransferase class V-fold PLP-dependent enzyme [Phormidium tenue FACHB-1052]OKH50885.1 cystathionine gamma-synthase [Phormidium tenue NIES-30]